MQGNQQYAKDILVREDGIVYFELLELQALEELTDEAVFGSSDFVIPPKQNGRFPVIAKLGDLLINYCPNGKASFSLEIKFIDRAKQQIQPLFIYDGERMPDCSFEDLVPLFLLEYYLNGTFCTNSLTPASIKIRELAGSIRNDLVTMALGKSVDQNGFRDICKRFLVAANNC